MIKPFMFTILKIVSSDATYKNNSIYGENVQRNGKLKGKNGVLKWDVVVSVAALIAEGVAAGNSKARHSGRSAGFFVHF